LDTILVLVIIAAFLLLQERFDKSRRKLYDIQKEEIIDLRHRLENLERCIFKGAINGNLTVDRGADSFSNQRSDSAQKQNPPKRP
jgi:hypothetical protein